MSRTEDAVSSSTAPITQWELAQKNPEYAFYLNELGKTSSLTHSVTVQFPSQVYRSSTPQSFLCVVLQDGACLYPQNFLHPSYSHVTNNKIVLVNFNKFARLPARLGSSNMGSWITPLQNPANFQPPFVRSSILPFRNSFTSSCFHSAAQDSMCTLGVPSDHSSETKFVASVYFTTTD